jgi:hypothetical protein
MTESDVRQSFLKQAHSCDALGSPFTARLCRLASRNMRSTSLVEQRLLSWPAGEIRQLGRSDFHGRWIRWQGW